MVVVAVGALDLSEDEFLSRVGSVIVGPLLLIGPVRLDAAMMLGCIPVLDIVGRASLPSKVIFTAAAWLAVFKPALASNEVTPIPDTSSADLLRSL